MEAHALSACGTGDDNVTRVGTGTQETDLAAWLEGLWPQLDKVGLVEFCIVNVYYLVNLLFG